MGVYLSEPNTKKETTTGSAKGIRYASCEMQGWRKNMEDAKICNVDLKVGNKNYYVFGVFDGHGGTQVSKYVENRFVKELEKLPEFQQGKIKQALEINFRRMDELMESADGKKELSEIRKKYGTDLHSNQDLMNAGCTANVLVIDDNNYYIANAGDSRAALYRGGKLVVLSQDHKPQGQIEKDRVEKAGGSIINGRVNGGLNLTRALGDFEYKKTPNLSYKEQMITCNPDIRVVPRQSNDEFILMGCDGICQPLLELVANRKKNQNNLGTLLENLLDLLLAKNTMEEVGCDNMTSIIIEFTK